MAGTYWSGLVIYLQNELIIILFINYKWVLNRRGSADSNARSTLYDNIIILF